MVEQLYLDLIEDCKTIKKILINSDIDEEEIIGTVKILNKHIKKYDTYKWEKSQHKSTSTSK